MKRRSLRRWASRVLGTAETSAEVYPLLDWRLAVRIGGVLWLIGALSPAIVLPFDPPTHIIGQAGWGVVLVFLVFAIASGIYLVVRPGSVSSITLLAMGYIGAVCLAIGQALTGPASQYGLAFVLLAAYHASVHPARRTLPLLACVVVVELTSSSIDGPTALIVVQTFAIVLLIVLMTLMALAYAHSNRSLAKQLIRLREEAEHRALTDPLTGLGNRRAFEEALARQVETAARYRQPLSLAMLDVDDFKSINDRLGHEAGDAALVAVTAAITSALRRVDICFRWGGDEFAILLPETRRDNAELVIDRVAESVRRTSRLAGGQSLSVGAGVSTLRVGETAGDLVERADARLLAAKHGTTARGDEHAAA